MNGSGNNNMVKRAMMFKSTVKTYHNMIKTLMYLMKPFIQFMLKIFNIEDVHLYNEDVQQHSEDFQPHSEDCHLYNEDPQQHGEDTVKTINNIVMMFNNTIHTVMPNINNMTLNKISNYMISLLMVLAILTLCSKG